MGQTRRVSGVATKIREEAGYTVVRYHSTDVVKFNSQEIILDSGGYLTVTTKLRMNQASNQYGLGYYVYQQKGDWFVRYYEGFKSDVDSPYVTVPFTDGMLIQRSKS